MQRATTLPWPALFVFLFVFVPAIFFEGRYRVLPAWIVPVLSVLGAVLVAVAFVARAYRRVKLERAAIGGMLAAYIIGTALALVTLIGMLLSPQSIDGRRLLGSALVIWLSNILLFSLAFWTVDRGGPVARAAGAETPIDLIFPEMTLPEYSSQHWRPRFGDYLYVSFNTATAFSATDTLTGSTRVRLLVMVEAIISLATIVIVAARAIGMVPGPGQ